MLDQGWLTVPMNSHFSISVVKAVMSPHTNGEDFKENHAIAPPNAREERKGSKEGEDNQTINQS